MQEQEEPKDDELLEPANEETTGGETTTDTEETVEEPLHLLTFRRYHSLAEAEELAEFLDKHGYVYLIEEDATNFDPTFSNNEYENKEYLVKIPQELFEEAEKLVDAHFKISLEEIEEDYYLLNFTNDELLDILKKPDEWSAVDHNLAREILEKRGKKVTDGQLEQWKTARMADLSQPKPAGSGLIISGYLFAILGGLVGVIIGYYVYSFKKVLPNGQQVYVYDERSRTTGKGIMILGAVMFVLELVGRFLLSLYILD